jgi:nicotinate dehydrogenase subunit A
MEHRAINIQVNGTPIAVTVAPDTALIFVLRNDVGLKGVRMGCGAGDCMACTVLVDGRPQQACAVPVSSAENLNIETVEALDKSDVGRSLIKSFIAEQAAQCGYCVAGILMRAKALLDARVTASRDEIVTEINGHLCRCGAHTRIVRAIARASKLKA